MIIYLIEDDEDQARYFQAMLERAMWAVQVFPDGTRALRAIQRTAPDVIVLDLRLPDIDGFQIIAWVREHYAALPVLVLTSATLESDLVEALEAGADDFLVKPPRERELVARIKALHRRTIEFRDSLTSITFGAYRIETMERAIYLDNGRVSLSPKEYEIVELLVRNVGQVVSRETMIGRVWGRAVGDESSRTLDTHIYRIRQKLNLSRRNGALLRSVYTHGYRLDEVGCTAE
ncbi:two-component system response regulator [Burkholderia mayonis]|uniref:Two-component system response regulator n=1 Tax=Burkholderia mayonis TaxID=1385591 RepID=A0A1B4FDY1_9BURK|nr:response regulator transcription factor [Burkholderia mayonis]AOJ01908.1 two-component system response regulator [Burkholderia mayonis]KVE46049.1 two-component system response regulator [Burkholderia mayonis]